MKHIPISTQNNCVKNITLDGLNSIALAMSLVLVFVAFFLRIRSTQWSHVLLPATLRPLTASNRCERENIDGNQEIQQVQCPQKIRSEEKLQQEKIEHQEIWPQSFEERGAGDEGVQAGKTEERIGWQGDQPEASRRDWTV